MGDNRREKHPYRISYKARWYRKNRKRLLKKRMTSYYRQLSKMRAIKLLVLSHYGKRGQLQCCWKGCLVKDVDVLTLDHLHDNGGQHRKAGFGSGWIAYAQLMKQQFPSGFQTLCANHQMKKELLRRRGRV